MMITRMGEAIALSLPFLSLPHLLPGPSFAFTRWLRWPLEISQETVAEWMEAIATPLTSWLDQHPPVAWAIHHPLISLGVFAILLLLIWSLFQAFVEILQELWMHVLKIPLHLGRWMLRGIARAAVYPLIKAVSHATGIDGLQRPASSSPSPSPSPSSEPSRLDLAPSHEASNGSRVHPHVHAPALADAAVSPPVEAPPTPPTVPADDSETIVQLLHRLEKLTHEQNQILHRIARLTENNHHTPTS